MRIEKFIVELLYLHDCVIIPGFGGLVANYRSARLNKSAHVIHPPSKHVGFNRHLLQNDGLLANSISVATGMSYKEVMSVIEDKVNDYKKSLITGGRIVWDKIGIFFHDQNGHLQFIPEEQENFLLDSYGFTSVQLTPIKKVLTISPEPIPAGEKQVEAEEITVGSKIKTNYWRVAAMVGGPIALGLGLWFSTSIMKNKFQMASLNPFQTGQVVSGYKMITPSEEFIYPNSPNKTGWELAKESMPGAESITFNFIEDKPSDIGIEVRMSPKASAPAETTATKFDKPVVKVDNEARFKVIGGAFSIESNAQRLVNELQSAGFNAHMAGKRGNLTLVAYGSFSSQEEAKSLLSKLRAEGKNVWLLSK